MIAINALKFSHFKVMAPLFKVNPLILVAVGRGQSALDADDLVTLDVELAQQAVVTLSSATQSNQLLYPSTIIVHYWLF